MIVKKILINLSHDNNLSRIMRNIKFVMPIFLLITILFVLILTVSCNKTPKFKINTMINDNKVATDSTSEYDEFASNSKVELIIPKTSKQPVTIPLVFVQGGLLTKGSTSDSQENGDDVNQKTIKVNPFYIGKYEVTQEQWKTVIGTDYFEFTGDNLPADNVYWNEAVSFCNVLSQWDGLTPCYSIKNNEFVCNWNADGYRLPTEAEWEFAARGGINSKGYAYSGSDNLDEVAWYLGNSERQSHPVGTKKANELGIYDMSGNVWEWCWDWYDYNKKSRVIKGGSWYSMVVYEHDDCVVSYRYYFFEPRTWEACIPTGLRICRNVNIK